MMKKLFGIAAILAAVAAFSLPITNLLQVPGPETTARLHHIQDARFRKAAEIFEQKCVDCHTAGARVPFYADLPVARDLIAADMKAGKAHLDLTQKLSAQGPAFSELDLARLDGVLRDRSMPPLRYVAMHWNAGLSDDDIQALGDWIRAVRAEKHRQDGVVPALAGEPFAPIPLKTVLNEDKIALGRRLFHDTRLSGDNTISCASCHALDKGGTDRAQFATGIRGQKGHINSPTVYNAVYNVKQFWDGRATDLVAQAHGPVHNPAEMGSSWAQVLPKLKQDPGYVASFQRLYPEGGMTGDAIADAIATFEKSLVTPNARFDQYLRGNSQALTAQERQGYQLFKQHCASCHAGRNFGGLSFERMGKKCDYFAARTNLALHEADNGVFNVSKQPRDKHRFKVPTLRNVEKTGPYFHDGTVSELRQAVALMGRYQVGREFSAQELDAMTAFLETLTGEYDGKPLQ
jgi:cytochrome c peroxidase